MKLLRTLLIGFLLTYSGSLLAQETVREAVDPMTLIVSVVQFLTGGWMVGIAIIATIILGLGMLFGFWDWRHVGKYIIGIVVVFGAASIIDILLPDSYDADIQKFQKTGYKISIEKSYSEFENIV